jgi:hypothetical protein
VVVVASLERLVYRDEKAETLQCQDIKVLKDKNIAQDNKTRTSVKTTGLDCVVCFLFVLMVVLRQPSNQKESRQRW